MRRKEVALALFGFLVGAVALAGGADEDWELIEQLRALQASAERVIQKVPVTVDYAPAVGTGYQLELFPVADLACGITDHLPPTQGYLSEDAEMPLFGGQSEEAPQPFGTVEELMELVRTSVEPHSWESGTINATGWTLVVYNSPMVLKKIGAMLGMLREKAHVCVNVELQMIDVPVALHRELVVGRGAALSDEQTEGLHRAIAGGEASVVFAGRALGLMRQLFYVTHGAQYAVLSDADVEVAQTSRTSDPVIDALHTGGIVAVRASVGDDHSNLTLDLDARNASLELPIRSRETEENGIIDMPQIDQSGTRTNVTVPSGRWVVAGIGSANSQTIRVTLAKATVVEPKGGAR